MSVIIIKKALVTEKAMRARAVAEYVFEVDLKANKIEISKAVSSAFGVEVLSVNTSIYKTRTRNSSKMRGHSVLHKKALVRLKEDQRISILERG